MDFETLKQRILAREARIGVIGLGYVGLPLAQALVEAGFPVVGFDIDPEKTRLLAAGETYINTVPAERVATMVASGSFAPTADFDALAMVDVAVICVPTPLTHQRTPDLSYVLDTGRVVARHLRPGRLVVLESTTYPGTTRGELKAVLEEGSGLRSGHDFFLGYSPERLEPGNTAFATAAIPRVVSGDGAEALALVQALYDQVAPRTIAVSSPEAAEAAKLTENVFRAVNIALVNELKVIFARMGIDIWEVIEAAKTKPYGFMPFYPGPGLGGHCIPIDPFYLSWKAREYGVFTRFIELAGEINTAMPEYVIGVLADAIGRRFRKAVAGARVLISGVAFKKNVDDTRESPALRLIQLLQDKGASVDYYDPLIPAMPRTREYPHLAGMRSVEWAPRDFDRYDAVLICADHDVVDYAALVAGARLVVDTRNATRAIADRTKIVMA